MIKNHAWLRPAGGIENEEKQAREEGRAMDAALIEGLRRAAQMPDSAERDALSAELYARVQACPCANDAIEPSDLPAIRRLAKGNAKTAAPAGEALLDKIYGGWLARAWRLPAGQARGGLAHGKTAPLFARNGQLPHPALSAL